MATSSTTWCESTSTSPVAWTSRSISECLPSWPSMWSKNGTPVATSVRPLPSRSSETTTFDSLVARSTRAVRPMSSDHLSDCGEEGVALLGRPDADAQPARQPDVAHQDPPIQQSLPLKRLVVEAAEQHEVGVAVDDVEPHSTQLGDEPVAVGAQLRDLTQRLIRVPQRRECSRLRKCGQVVRQPHQTQRIDDGRIRGEISDARAGERKRLGHRPGDDESRMTRQL